jgi:hypothetical protein
LSLEVSLQSIQITEIFPSLQYVKDFYIDFMIDINILNIPVQSPWKFSKGELGSIIKQTLKQSEIENN